MFNFLYSERKKIRQNAKHGLEIAQRVYCYRRDQLNEAQLNELRAATEQVRLRLKGKADIPQIKSAVALLEGVLKKTGGRIYPGSSIRENVEFFLVAFIVLLGFRAYFAQNFKIPTNSMWPSYYGMTSKVFPAGEEPGLARRLFRLATLGATNYSVMAPADGEVSIAVFGNGQLAYSEHSGRSMLVFPTPMKEYVFSVAGTQAHLAVPSDFVFDKAIEDAFFRGNLSGALAHSAQLGKPLKRSALVVQRGEHSGEVDVYWIPLGKTMKKGEPILAFDVLSGDLLFVDRISSNFFPPKVGSGFVFKTDHIHSPHMMNASGHQIEQFYIKRLVGGPGDHLEMRPPATSETGDTHGQLFRNGQPIDGAVAFNKNARKEGLYTGYTAEGLLAFGQSITVPQNSYFAMGDNSSNSNDSRFWGFVPDKDVVGRPLFIYYPLTQRWGPAN